MILSFSGMDGAGKSTQIEILKDRFESSGKKVHTVWARGGYTPGFEFLKKVVRKALGKKVAPPGRNKARTKTMSNPVISRVWLMLAMLDLAFLYGLKLRLLSLRGRVIICDRYLDDTRLDFQLNFPGIDFERTFEWRFLKCVTPTPQLSFLLLLSVDQSMERSKLKFEPFPDDRATLERRLSAYQDQDFFPAERYHKLDGSEALETLTDIIFGLVDNETHSPS